MISNFKKKNKKADIMLMSMLVLCIVIGVWLFLPPRNKFMQFAYFFNNIRYSISEAFDKSSYEEYLFHRNNALYLAKIYPEEPVAIDELKIAFKALPKNISESELQLLYKESAEIKLFLKDRKGALNDYLLSGNLSYRDNFKVAMLFKDIGRFREAANYCNEMLKFDSDTLEGYACLAEVYRAAGNTDVAIRIWNLLIDRTKNNPRAHVYRANLKKSIGDNEGYQKDLKVAKEYSPSIKVDENVALEILNPQNLELSTR